MTWALVVLHCVRLCVPQYVELYPTKTICEAKIPKEESWLGPSKNMYCIPAVQGETK